MMEMMPVRGEHVEMTSSAAIAEGLASWIGRAEMTRRWSLARLPLRARSRVSERLEFATFYAQSPSPPIRFRRLRVNRAQLIGLEIFFRPR